MFVRVRECMRVCVCVALMGGCELHIVVNLFACICYAVLVFVCQYDVDDD